MISGEGAAQRVLYAVSKGSQSNQQLVKPTKTDRNWSQYRYGGNL